MLSGFFLIKGIYDGKYNYSVWHYTIIRIERLYPHVVFSFLVLFIYSAINGYSIGGVVSQLYGHLCEIIPFLYTFRQERVYVQPMNYTVWYVDTLLIDSIILFYVINNHRRFFVEIGMTLIAFVGLADLSLGCIAYCVTNRIKGKLTKRHLYLAKLIEYCGFGFVIVASFFVGKTTIDVSYVFILFLSLICMNLYEGSKTISDSRLIVVLSQLSYAIYLNQLFVIIALPKVFHIDNVADNVFTMILYLSILIMYSAITNWIVKYVVNKCKKHAKFLCIQ